MYYIHCTIIDETHFSHTHPSAKLKALAQQEQGEGGQESRSCHELLRERKEKRDYKRRRQKYRAKNVHITRRKTSEVSTVSLLKSICVEFDLHKVVITLSYLTEFKVSYILKKRFYLYAVELISSN